MLDFGAWADEHYALPVENAQFTEEELEIIENELKKKVKE